MKILNNNNDLNLILNNIQTSKVDLGWSESFQDFEKESLESVINVAENYETIRYIHKPYSGITTNNNLLQTDFWTYFYFISGSSYVQNYEAIGLDNQTNSSALRASANSFFRLEFYKTPNNEPPTRLNRRLVFAKNLTLPLGEKYYLTGNTFNDYVFVPVFMGSNYKNKENMYLFWFLDDSAFNETTLTGTTFYMAARFFNSVDGSIIEFTNKDLSANNSTLFTNRRGLRNLPIKFYEKGITGGVEIVESEDMYYRVEMDRSDYSYEVYFDSSNPPPTPTMTPTPTPTKTPTVTPSVTTTPSITPSPSSGFIAPTPTITPSISSAPISYALINIYASTNSAIVGYPSPINIAYNINNTGYTSTTTTVSANPNTPSSIYSILVPIGSNIKFALRNYTSSSSITFGASQSIPSGFFGYCGISSPYEITSVTSGFSVYLNAQITSFNVVTC